jgi:hypothetical protein
MLSMTASAGAVLAAIAGGVTGIIDVTLRPAQGRSPILGAVAGAAIGAAAFATFLFAGFAVSLLTFSGAPDPGPALIAIIIGCAALLGIRALHATIAPRFGFPERRPSERRGVEDLIEARPRGGAPTKWLGGIGLAALPALYGIQCLVTQQGQLGTTIWPSKLEGGGAIALGIGWLGVGLFLHFHFFFGLHPRLDAYSKRGKSIALVIAGAGLTMAGAWSVFSRVPL